MQSQLKLAFLVDSIQGSHAGTERQVLNLYNGLQKVGIDAQVYCLRGTEYTESAESGFRRVESVNIKSFGSPASYVKILFLGVRLRKEGVKIVHAYFPDACFMAPLLKIFGLIVITSRRDMGLLYKSRSPMLMRISSKFVDAVISNSNNVSEFAKDIERLPDWKCHVIPNGVAEIEGDPGESLYNRAESFKIILVANIKPIKRTLDALISISEVIKRGYDVELMVVGEVQDLSYEKEILKFIEKSNLYENVLLIGKSSNPSEHIRLSDIGMLLSESEGLSNSLLEYLQCGTPVIATAVGGNSEVVSHAKDGFLVKVGDTTEIAEKLIELIENRALREYMAVQAKLAFENRYTINIMVNRHIDLYSKLIKKWSF